MKLVLILFMFVTTGSLAQNENSNQTSENHLSKEGDTKMGADAAESGTDVSDQEIQAQEEKKDNDRLNPQLPREENEEALEVDENR